jgi:hypothetical protein
MYVSNVSDVIKVMLQVFRMDVAKLDRDVVYVASVSEACCNRSLKMFSSVFRRMLLAFLSGCCTCFTHMLQEYVRNVSAISVLYCKLQMFYLDVAYVSHICCTYMSQMFHLLQTYVAFKCFMLYVYVSNISSASDLCCIQVFRVSEVRLESHRSTAWVLGEGGDEPRVGRWAARRT